MSEKQPLHADKVMICINSDFIATHYPKVPLPFKMGVTKILSMRTTFPLKTIDLFAGIGGIRKGFEMTGKFQTVFANDFDKNCKLTYDRNFGTTKLTVADVKDISMKKGHIPEFNFLVGGFPCQAFSVAIHGKGFHDEKGRGVLFNEIYRLLCEAVKLQKEPPVGFFLENVRNLKSHDGGKTFKTIMAKLAKAGYHTDYRVYNSLDFGVPQNRERIYIVGFRDEKVLQRFKWPEPNHSRSKVRDFLERDVDPVYYYNGTPLFEKIKNHVTNPDYVYLYRRNHVRTHRDGHSPTLVASMGLGGHNVPIIRDSKGIRRLTPTECARLQGYDDLQLPPGMSDVHAYKQIGNSVTVPVIHKIADAIVDALGIDSLVHSIARRKARRAVKARELALV